MLKIITIKPNALFNQERIRVVIAPLLLLCFGWVTYAHAQPTDLQWHIWNGQGRSTAVAPRTVYSGTIGQTLHFENVNNLYRTCHIRKNIQTNKWLNQF